MSTSPRARARPSIETASTGSTISGNSVTMSMRIGSELQQALRGPDHDPARREVHVQHDLAHGGDQVLAPLARDDPAVLRAPALDAGHAPPLAAVLRQHTAARELPRVELAPRERQRLRLGQ